MKQFYRMQISSEEKAMVFEKPVRKLSISASFDTTIKLHFTDGSVSEAHTLYSRNPLYLDFQTANNGGGVSAIYLTEATKSGGFASVSIIEYGTGGNIDWYK